MDGFYSKKTEDVFKELESSEHGLSSQKVKHRLEKYGYNELVEKKKKHPIFLFLEQFKNVLIWVLVAATIISAALGEYVDAIVIGVILILNAILGFIQEYKAEKAIEALKKMASLKAIVVRDGIEVQIDAKEIVPGDILILSEGEKVPADARLIEIVSLHTQEAALTGESIPVKKDIAVLKEDTSVADRKNMVFAGTIITRGHGKAIVTSTGMSTEFGKIAHMIQEVETEATPLQKKLGSLGKWLAVLTLAICGIIFAISTLVIGENIINMFIFSVSLAVAAIPEGLPAVVTICLALGIQRMAKKNALMRHLPTVETLGSCTVICSDKTGTLTHNEMTVREIYANGKTIAVEGSGYVPQGKFSHDPKHFEMLFKIGALCNNARLLKQNGAWIILGDPTEGSLIVSAQKAGLLHEDLNEELPRIDEIPFSSERKMMTTVHKTKEGYVVYTKGAPDVLLKLCAKIYDNGRVRELTQKDKENILAKNEEFAEKALRVLGFAYKQLAGKEKYNAAGIEKELVFVGLQGMIDPPRAEVKEAIAKCKSAGIKVVMITGDHKNTAMAIAKELGIHGRAITGEELYKIEDLEDIVEDIAIYARVNPEDKLKIVDALKKKNHIVAMTGDGVNDAPAIKKADIGISMGMTGTDVAREASNMTLIDDNFATIVSAIKEGRRIYNNIKKTFAFLLSGNIAEVLIIFIVMLISTLFFGNTLPLPLIAIQILWINLVTDGLPALALSVDPIDEDVMSRKPRRKEETLFTKTRIYLVDYPVIVTIGTLALFFWSFYYGNVGDIIKAQTIVFTTVILFEKFQSYSCRSLIKPVGRELLKNKFLNYATILTIVLQLVILYVPMFNKMFHTTPLTAMEWLLIAGVSAIAFVYLESYKFLMQKRESNKHF